MKLKLTKLIPLIIASLLGIQTITTLPTYAEDSTDICNIEGIPDDVKAASGCNEKAGYLPDVVINILNIIIGISSFIAVIFIIIGGVTYMTSAGDASKTAKAKNTILYACIGLAVCALAFAIVNFAVRGINDSAKSKTSLITENSIAFLEKKL